MSLSKISISAALLLCTILSAAAVALPDDREKTISIESDSAERNEKTGLTVYQGNVIISQGSILIEADKITLHYQGSHWHLIRSTSLGRQLQSPGHVKFISIHVIATLYRHLLIPALQYSL